MPVDDDVRMIMMMNTGLLTQDPAPGITGCTGSTILYKALGIGVASFIVLLLLTYYCIDLSIEECIYICTLFLHSTTYALH